MQNLNLPSLLLGSCLLTGMASGGFFISQTLYKANAGINTAEVKGLAERQVMADQAHWQLIFSVATKDKGRIKSLYQQAQQQQTAIVELLKESGFAPHEIQPGVLDYHYQEYRDSEQKLIDEKHQLTGSVTVNTDEVTLVSKVRAEVNRLVEAGMQIDNRAPRYLFTQLNSIKPKMLKEATQNAKLAAREFAMVADVEVGAIKQARQGNFRIRDVGEEYTDDRALQKTVRVVTTITFYLDE